MVLDNYRSILDWWLVPLATALRRVHPDVFTWASLAAALAGGVAFYLSGPDGNGPFWLAAAFVGVGLNSILDLLDGKVAKMTGQATPRGDYLDHAVDRFSDTSFLVGITLSVWTSREWIGVLAITCTLLTSYMGTQAQAVGLKRHYGGLLGRADRMVLLLAIPLLEVIEAIGGWPYLPERWGTSWLELMLLYFGLVGALTTVQRFVAGLRGFGRDGRVR